MCLNYPIVMLSDALSHNPEGSAEVFPSIPAAQCQVVPCCEPGTAPLCERRLCCTCAASGAPLPTDSFCASEGMGQCLRLEKVGFLDLCFAWLLGDLNSLYFLLLLLGFPLILRILHFKEGARALCWPRVSYAAFQQQLRFCCMRRLLQG